MSDDKKTAIKAAAAAPAAATFSFSIEDPHLTDTDSESIRVFLRKYDQYCREVKSRARQIGDGSPSSEVARPANLKFCVDAEFLESKIALGFIEGVS